MNLYIYTASQEATEYSGSRFHIRPTVKLFPCNTTTASWCWPQWAHAFLISTFYWFNVQNKYEQYRINEVIIIKVFQFLERRDHEMGLQQLKWSHCALALSYIHILMLATSPFELMHCEMKCLMKIAIESALLWCAAVSCGDGWLLKIVSPFSFLIRVNSIFHSWEGNY